MKIYFKTHDLKCEKNTLNSLENLTNKGLTQFRDFYAKLKKNYAKSGDFS